MKARAGRPLVAVAVVCAVLAVGVTTAIAAAPSPRASTVFHACLKDGTLSKVGTSAKACGSGSLAVSWDRKGPRGAKGSPGAPGAPGAKGATGATGATGPSNTIFVSATNVHVPATLGSVLGLILPAGSYVANADLSLEDESASNSSDLTECTLTLGTASDSVDVGLLGPSSTPLNYGAMSLTVAGTITATGVAEVKCVGAGKDGNTYATSVYITAIESGKVTAGL